MNSATDNCHNDLFRIDCVFDNIVPLLWSMTQSVAKPTECQRQKDQIVHVISETLKMSLSHGQSWMFFPISSVNI